MSGFFKGTWVYLAEVLGRIVTLGISLGSLMNPSIYDITLLYNFLLLAEGEILLIFPIVTPQKARSQFTCRHPFSRPQFNYHRSMSSVYNSKRSQGIAFVSSPSSIVLFSIAKPGVLSGHYTKITKKNQPSLLRRAREIKILPCRLPDRTQLCPARKTRKREGKTG